MVPIRRVVGTHINWRALQYHHIGRVIICEFVLRTHDPSALSPPDEEKHIITNGCRLYYNTVFHKNQNNRRRSNRSHINPYSVQISRTGVSQYCTRHVR
jgi:hypothetical protein